MLSIRLIYYSCAVREPNFSNFSEHLPRKDFLTLNIMSFSTDLLTTSQTLPQHLWILSLL